MDKVSTLVSSLDEFESPAVKAAVAEERRFGGIESSLVSLRASVDALTSKIGEQNGRVGKLEVQVSAVANEAKANAIVNKAYQEGRGDTLSFIDKIMMRVTATASTIIAIYIGLQQAGFI